MKQRLHFLTHLRDGVNPVDYERFLRETEYMTAMKLIPTITYYRTTRLEGRVKSVGKPLYAYAEVIDVDDLGAFRTAILSPNAEVAELRRQGWSYLHEPSVLDLYGTVIE